MNSMEHGGSVTRLNSYHVTTGNKTEHRASNIETGGTMRSGENRNPKPEVRLEGNDSQNGTGEMLNKHELAKRLRISLRTVEKWQSLGILSYIKIGRVVLFHWPDVVAYLKTNFHVSRRTLRIRRAALERVQ